MVSEDKNTKNVMGGGLVDTFYHTLDPKKRLTIPSEWRDAMGMDGSDKAYVYVFPDAVEECLDLVPVREMERLLADLTGGDVLDTDPDATAIAQSAQMLKVDAAGRIRIGDALLDFAGVRGDVTLVGAFRKAQIWSGERKPKTRALDIAAFRAAVARRRAQREGGAS